MKTATVGKIQKNFAAILKEVRAGEEFIVTRRGEPVARITAIGPKQKIDWPDFFKDAIAQEGKPVSELVIDEREDRF